MPSTAEWIHTATNAAAMLVLVGALHASSIFNIAFADFYHAIHEMLCHRLCEGLVAVASFAFAAFFFSAIEACGVPKLRTRVLQPAASLDATGCRLVIEVQRPTAVDLKADQTKVIRIGVDSVRSKSQTFFPRAGKDFWFWFAVNVGLYLGIIDVSQRVLGDSAASLHYASPEPPSIVRVAVEVAFSVWAYDLLFWWIHRSWHGLGRAGEHQAASRHGRNNFFGSLRRRWCGWHSNHHDHYSTPSESLFPMSTFHHHLLDASLQVGINIVVQQVPLAFLFAGPRHKFSKVVHNLVVTYLLVEAHSGFDLPFMSHRLLPAIFGGSVRHQIHHQQGWLFFHQFFRYLDDRTFRAKHLLVRRKEC
jgi:sterol desaturase/sphingolipid hydroxylase (fatty acid hydroxylase superfamily)